MELSQTLALINDNIRMLRAYHLEPRDTRIKLNQNENPFDWPVAIKEEIARFCIERPWNRYPSFVPDELRAELANYAGVGPENVIVGNGSNEMLLVLLLALVNKNAGVIICQPTFTVYRLLSSGLGASGPSLFLTPELQYNSDSISSAIRKNPRAVLILCSPNNPTGSELSEAQIRRLLSEHSGFCILDQAYIEFGGFNAVPLLKEYPNLVITRTFSKAFAGAGLRLGYMLGSPEIVAEINKIKLPYNINFFSEHVAKVLLRNRKRLDEGLSVIVGQRKEMFDFLRALPLENVYPSAANFILIRSSRKDELFDHLLKSEILIRDVSSYPMLENCLRISIGSEPENDALKSSMKEFFAGI